MVAPGDTLSAIAARAGTTGAALAAANGLDANGVLPAGSAIRVSGTSSGSSSSAGLAGEHEQVVGVRRLPVVPGDTLTAIAARAGTTPAALAAANGLSPKASCWPARC